jgi:hypothetical protein
VAQRKFEHCCARFESRPVCRDCLPVVHRRPAVAIYTGFAPRWLAVLGYVLLLLLLLLFGSYYIRWSFAVFPLWVFLISLCILVENLRRPTEIGEDRR